MIVAIEPCVRCGECCRAVICPIGIDAYHTKTAPCPGLLKDNDVTRCEQWQFIVAGQWLGGHSAGICDSDFGNHDERKLKAEVAE